MCALNDQVAIAMSAGEADKNLARIYRTDNAGASWKPVSIDLLAGVFFNAMSFWDDQHGLILCDPIEGEFILYTTQNGGCTWERLAPPSA